MRDDERPYYYLFNTETCLYKSNPEKMTSAEADKRNEFLQRQYSKWEWRIIREENRSLF